MVDVVGFEGPPEFYSDAAVIAMNPFGLVISFGLLTESPGSQKTQAIVRMSPQHALALTQLLRTNLRHYEEMVGPIALPEDMKKELGLDQEGI